MNKEIPFINYDENRHKILNRRSPVDMIYLIPEFVSIEGKMQAISGALEMLNRSHLKIKILDQYRGGAESQTGGILSYFEDLK